jgi:hypothetical protein
MGKWAQGVYSVRNPAKYVGRGEPRYRSSWEFVFFTFCDNNDKILKWASESIHIPYRNPFTGKQTIYIPDAFIQYQNNQGLVISEIVEIKPKSQTLIQEKVTSARDRAAVALNHAKWAAARAYCDRIGCKFRVITETEMFYNGRKR